MNGLWFPLIAGALVGVATACTDDGRAVTDLPEENITLDTARMDIIVSADEFPNIGHKCHSFGEGAVIGFWTTTDRTLILIYNDHACEGANRSQDMVVINGVPRAVVNSGS